MENTAPQGTTVGDAAKNIAALIKPTEEEGAPPVEAVEAESEETAQSPPEPEVRTFKVKVDGEEVEVPEDEVLKGYSRTADYTRKTQKLAEERKALEAEVNAVKQERSRYAEGLKILESQLQPRENVDWNRLREEDPIAYATKKLEERDRQDQLALVQAEQRRIAQLESEEQAKALQRYVQEEQAKLADAIPEWKDAKVAKAEKEKLSNYLQSLGYSEAEIAQIYDHRAVVALRKAALYDEMMSKAKDKVEKAKDSPKVAPPGNAPSGTAQFRETRERFQKTGSVRDASSLIKQMLRN